MTITAADMRGRAEGMFLKAPKGDAAARNEITFGGAAIAADSGNGHWTALNPCKSGQTTVRVPAASAAVVRIGLRPTQ